MKKFYTLALAAALFFASGCKKEEAEARNFEYVVNCSSCDLTYSDYQENTVQTTAGNGWSYHIRNASHGQFLYISAQNNSSSGSVSVTIKHNGTAIKSGSSSGAYVIATASYSVQ